MDAPDDPPGAPVPLRRASGLVLLQAVALALLGVGYAVSGAVGRPEDRLATVLAGLLAVAAGLALLPVGRGLGVGRSWALAPVVVAEALLVVVAVGLLQGGVLVAGAPVLAVAAGVLYLLATPASRAAFRATS